MTVCAHRPTETPGFFTPCERRVDGVPVKCKCGAEVAELEKALAEETREDG